MIHPFTNFQGSVSRCLKLTLVAGVLVLSACNTPSEPSSDLAPEPIAAAEESPTQEEASPAQPETSSQEASSQTEIASAEAIPTESADSTEGETVWAIGTFEGRSGHVVSGSVEVVESNGQYFVQLGDDFYLDGAPDPKVGLGSNGYDPATKAGDLTASTGASTYEISAGINVQQYNEVYIWCERFNVPLGLASLQVQ